MIKEKCLLGFNWIIANHPEWIDNIDLSILDQKSFHRCIIGQNTDFYDFRDKYGENFCISHGFFCDRIDDYALFTEEFKRLINEHRGITQPAFYDCNQPTKTVELESILNKTIDKVEMKSNVCSFQFKDGTTYYIDFYNAKLRQVFKS